MAQDNFKKILKNSLIVLTGNVGANIFGLLSVSIFSQSMGVKIFGFYVLFITFIEIIDKIFNFQTWQAFIKYAIDFQIHKEKNNLMMLLKYCFLIDLYSLCVAFVIAYLSVAPFMKFFDIPFEYVHLVMIMAVSFVFNVFDISIGIFRVFDEFKVQSKIAVTASFIKLTGFSLVAITIPSFDNFVYAVIFSQFITFSLKLYYSKIILNNNGYKVDDIFKEAIDYKVISELKILSFIIYNNFNIAVRMVSRQLDVVIIGKLYGAEVVAIYRIAKDTGGIIGRLTDPIYQTIYPELANLLASGKKDEAKEVAIKVSKFTGLAGIVVYVFFILFGSFAINVAFGSAFIDAYDIVIIYFIAIMISIITLPLTPILFSYGLAKEALYNQVLATLAYVVVLYPLVLYYDAIGAAVAYIVFYIAWTISTLSSINKKVFL